MLVLAISGSLRGGSYNTALLRAVAETPPPGLEVELYDGLCDVPPYDEDADREPEHPAVADIRDRVAAADAVLIATPEYNSSIPGVLKNALDWVSRPYATNSMRGKPVAVIGTSTGSFGAIWAQAELKKVLGTMGGRVLDIELPIPYAAELFDERGRLVDDEIRSVLASTVDELAAAAEQVEAAA